MNPFLYLKALEAGNPAGFTLLLIFAIFVLVAFFADGSRVDRW